MSETAGQIKARHVGEQPCAPTMRLVSQSSVDKAREFVIAVKLVEDTFGSVHSGSLAAVEVLNILGLEDKP